MDVQLTSGELNQMVERVFSPTANDRALAILVDLPDAALADNEAWRVRRTMAANWARALAASAGEPGRETALVLYRNARANNADLPDHGCVWDLREELPATAEELADRVMTPMEEILSRFPLALAPTELSATAPLKMLCPKYGCRAATMPGFSPQMVPALRLDYAEVNRRVNRLKSLLDEATGARIELVVEDRPLELSLDLRHRTAHASGGLLPRPGMAGNLPSGEAYIVPYEGECQGDPSRSRGLLPVELDGEVVVYRIEENRAVEVLSGGPVSAAEARLIAAEPAYANLAELGLGVLAAFGVRPVGEVLLDEKLGLHIAFGRSEHFGGMVGPSDFSGPEAVTHQDRVYIDELQPAVNPAAVDLVFGGDTTMPLMRDGRYVIDFAEP